jgi:type I protein arginine methyltransferase
MYNLRQFSAMLADRIRMDAYVAAIEKTVREGNTVVDLGCGPGVFALLACKSGARRVYAIDVNGIVEFGRHLAALNGLSDRIHFLHGDSRHMHLPERADVIISDVRGALPLFSGAVATLQDASRRLLCEHGRLIPLSDTLFCALVELPDAYSEIVAAWNSRSSLNLSAAMALSLNDLHGLFLRAEQVISDAVPWHKLQYANREVTTTAASDFRLTTTRAAAGHGLGLWFETELVEGIGYSTDPRCGKTVYGHVFLPWLEPVSLHKGDTVTVDLRAHLVGNDYIWQWETTIPACNGRPATHFRQSTFYGSVFSPSFLKKHATDFVPVLSETGLAERWLFQSMDGHRSLEDIAAEAARLFPQVFRRVEDAFNRAADIAEEFSR